MYYRLPETKYMPFEVIKLKEKKRKQQQNTNSYLTINQIETDE